MGRIPVAYQPTDHRERAVGNLTTTIPMTIPTTITGTSRADRLIGITNASNRIYGLGGDDLLIGGRQADQMWGGPGRDRFVVRRGSVDRFVDFHWRDDKILLNKAEFPNIRRLSNARLPILNWSMTSSSDLVYLMHEGRLYYNANGTAPGWGDGGGLIAELGRPGWIGPPRINGNSIVSVEFT
jgi:Ca2+-binding RTX toxin-like protein